MRATSSASVLPCRSASVIEPRSLVFKIELHTQTPIDLAHDLIIFDEVGTASGRWTRSSISPRCYLMRLSALPDPTSGCSTRLRLGRCEHWSCSPCASRSSSGQRADESSWMHYRDRIGGPAVHQHLWSQLLDYCFVGGMPEAVARWFAADEELLRGTQDFTAIHRDLVTQYERDFGGTPEGSTRNTSERCFQTCHASWPTAKMAQCAVSVSRVSSCGREATRT